MYIGINRKYAYCDYGTDACGIRRVGSNTRQITVFMSTSTTILVSLRYQYLFCYRFCIVKRFFLPRTHLATPSHAQQTSTHRTSAHTIRETITFSASMLELRLWRNELKCEIRESGREKEMEKTRMKGERAGERAGIHSQVGEKHTCPNPLLLAAVFLST